MSKNNKKSSKSSVKCGSCSVTVESDSEEGAIECDKCLKWFHAFCSGLKSTEVKAIFEDSSLPYTCKICTKKISTSATSSEQNITSKFVFTLNHFEMIMKRFDELSSIKDTVEFLSENQKDIQEKQIVVNKQIKNINKETDELNKKIALQNIRLNALENSKLKSMCFLKIPSSSFNKDTFKNYIVTIIAAAGLQVKLDDLKSAIFQQKMSNSHGAIIKIEFKEESMKFEVMKSKSKLRDLPNFKNVTFFDVLSRDAAELFKYAKTLKECGFKYVYHRGGRVFVKKQETDQPVAIPHKRKVDELIQSSSRNAVKHSNPDFTTPVALVENTDFFNRRRTVGNI